MMNFIKNKKFVFELLILISLFLNIGSTIHLFLPGHFFDLQSISHLIFSGVMTTTLFFGLIPIYKKEDRRYGIEEHYFNTSIMLIGLSILLHTLNLLISLPAIVFLIAAFFGLIVLSVDFIMLYFHLTDSDRTPVSYFYTSQWKQDVTK